MKLKYLLRILVVLVIVIVSAVYIQHSLSLIKEQVVNKKSTKLLNDLKIEETYAEDIGFVVLAGISENKQIIQALKKNDRNIAILELNSIISEYKQKTNIQNLKIHIHTADVKSFIRSWKLDKYGDDLSGFRETINEVKATEKPIFAFEIGRIGLTLRSLLPIIDNGKYLGSIEFIQQFDQAPEKFEKQGNQYLLLMNKSYLNIAKYLKDAPEIANYKVSSKFFNKNFIEEARKIDMNKMLKNHYLLTDKYLFVYKIIKDVKGKELGLHLLAMPSEEVHKMIVHDKKEALILYSMFIVGILFVFIVIYFAIKK